MLAEIFTSDTRAQVFRILFNGAEKEHYLREIERLSGKSIRAIQQEVQHLKSIDLIQSRKDGNRLYYKANILHPLYPDLVSIVEKTVGVIPLLYERLNEPRVSLAFLFGSFAMDAEKSESDIDLIVVGDLGMRSLSKLLSGLQEKVGREINPHIFTREEFKKRLKSKDHFISSVLKSETKAVVGSLDEYRSNVKKRNTR